MEKSKNIFTKTDEFIFKKIDFFKSDSSFQKINDLLTNFSDEQQKIISQILAFVLIVSPYIFVIIFWWGNHTLKNRLEIKSQILEQITTLTNSKENKANISSVYLAPSSILSIEDLENNIKNLMSRNNIEQNKINIANFTQLSSTSSISKIEALLIFQNFGSLDFSNFLRALVDQEKFKIITIKLIKNKETDLLNGEFTIMHLGKNSPL